MKKKLADLISYILSPISLAFYVIIILSVYRIPIQNQLEYSMTIIVAILFLCITPIIGILFYTKKGVIDIWVSDQKIRTPFYLVAIGGYVVASVLFFLIGHHEFMVLTLAYLGVTMVITLVNLKIKVSSHTGGLMGPLTALFYLFGVIMLPLFLLLPVVMWARLELNAHSTIQLVSGAIIGFVVTYTTYLSFY